MNKSMRLVAIFFLISQIVVLSACSKNNDNGLQESESSGESSSEALTTESSSETTVETTTETASEVVTEAKIYAQLSSEMKAKLAAATPSFVDLFDKGTHSPDKVSTLFYSAELISVQKVTYGEGKDSGGITLTDYDSYVGYPPGILNPSEGTLRFYYKPPVDLYSAYSTRQDPWLDYGNIAPPFNGFFLDTVGWASAFPGSFSASLGFKEGDSKYTSANFGTFSGSNWSYATGDLPASLILSGDEWYDIMFCYSKDKNKLALYINEILIGEAVYITELSTSEGFFIGQSPWPFMELTYWPYGPHTLKGTYSNFRVYNEAFCD